MSGLSESYTVHVVLPDFLWIEWRSLHYTRLGEGELNGALWFERRQLAWVINAIETVMTIDRVDEQRLEAGNDALIVSESGHEAAPNINLDNRRPEGSPHAGRYWVCFTKPLAQKLLQELRELNRT